MLKKILLGLGIVVLMFFGFVALQNAEYTIARETVVAASPDKIFPYINHNKKTEEWMPWREQDPTVKMTYAGPEEGVGSTSSWTSEGKMGVGKAEVVESIPNERVKTQLTYQKPFEMSQVAEVSLKRVDGGTAVRWSVTGKNTFIARIFCFFMDMDKMVGGEFEKGLGKLKSIVEKR